MGPALPGRQARARARALTAELLARCTFPSAPSPVTCAFSGGQDSTALILLACEAGLDVTAHHVDHRIRTDSPRDAARAAAIASTLGVRFTIDVVQVAPGSNLEARARAARRSVLPHDAMTGHTADDQAETVLLRLLRGSAANGLAAIEPGPRHPILAIRRSDTEAVCRTAGIEPVRDASNLDRDVWRNRVRAELLPLAADIAGRDVVPILGRTADLLRDDSAFLDGLSNAIDPTDACAVRDAPIVLARRALRRWLTERGYPPDAAAIDRVLAVAAGAAGACEVAGGRRVERSGQRLRVVERTDAEESVM
ncbi:MAG: tRNA lysidine(34) synthetase TilS [Ilumatobacteraceae bacterium]